MRATSWGHALLAFFLIVIATVFVFVDPYPQPQSYHRFADRRTLLDIPNFWNVVSNAFFLVPGIAGLWIFGSGKHPGIVRDLSTAYHILFAGALLTAFGSAWFHLAPSNKSLFWDRLPMTIAFMSLTAIIVGEHVSVSLGRRLLWPLLAVGAVSVIYWDYSEARNAGDLRLYGLVQFLPLLLMPLILLVYPSIFDRTRQFWVLLAFYIVAKVFELLDGAIYDQGQLISGHALKHVCAALGLIALLHGIMRRRRLDRPAGVDHDGRI